MKLSFILRGVVSAALAMVAVQPDTLHAATFTWIGGTGNWSNGLDWLVGVPNANDANVFVDNGNTLVNSVVSVDGSFTVGQITIDSGDTVGINNAEALTVTDAGGFGSIINNGTLSINAGGNFTQLQISGNVGLSGSGVTTLGGANAYILGSGRLTNSSTINGQGNLGDNQLAVTNSATGLIDANVSAGILSIDPQNSTGSFLNQGTMQASNGGILSFTGNSGGVVDNTGGKIQALNGSEVRLVGNVSISNGTFSTTGSGVIDVAAGNIASLTAVTNSGSLVVNNAAQLNLSGAIVDNGTISVNSAGNVTALSTADGTVFSGTGAVQLGANANNEITGGGTLTNSAGHTISGGGDVGSNQIVIANAGLINANLNGVAMTVDPANVTGTTNTGTMQASNGGVLSLTGSGGGAFDNTGGTIQALDGSQVQLTGSVSIANGTLSTTGTGVIHTVASQTVTLTNVTNLGTFVADNNSTTNLSGTITNSGSMKINAGGNVTDFTLTGDVTLNGGGTVSLVGPARIDGSGNRLTNVNNTIQGQGNLGNNQIAITNQSLIDANLSGQTLTIDPANVTNAFINSGTLRASNGGTLVLTGSAGGAFDNTSGTIRALDGSQVQLTGSVSITGGTLSTTGSGVIGVAASNIASLSALTNSGPLVVNNAAQLNLSGAIVDNGTISLNSLGNTTALSTADGTVLSGSGAVLLGAAANNEITGGGTLTNSAGHTISGGGDVGSNALVLANAGLINANLNGVAMTVDPANVTGTTNTGTMQASNGGILSLTGNAGGAFDNTSGTIQALDGSQVQLVNNVSIANGTLSTTGTGAIHTVASQTVTLTNVTNLGTFVGDNNSITNLSGTITNSGTMTINATGNNTDFTLTSDVTLNGGGTVSLVGPAFITGTGNRLTNVDNTIQGQGDIGNNQITITNQGLIDANLSGKTLTIDPANVASAFINSGTLRASNGGTLVLSGSGGGGFSSTAGSFVTALNLSEVQLDGNVALATTTLSTTGSGDIRVVSSQTASLTDVTNLGTFVGDNNSITNLSGTITNSGTMTINATGNNTDFTLTGDVTLNGGGTVSLVGPAFITGTGNRLTNVDNTIQGQGNLGNNQITITNQGLIDANLSGKTLTIDPANVANAFINSGTLEASNGGTLVLSGSGGGGFSSTAGSFVTALNLSEVQLDGNVALATTTLSTTGSGDIRVVSSQTASLTDVTNLGTFVGDNNSITQLSGTITNSGSMKINSTGNVTDFTLTGDVTLNGGGTVSLVSSAVITGSGNRLTNVDNTIQGQGNLGNNQITITNQGLINANLSGQTLTVDPANVASAFLNQGTMQASNGGILSLTGNAGGAFDNTSGTIQALDGSQVQLVNNVSIANGTLSTTGTGVIHTVASQTVTLTNVTNLGTFVGDNNSNTQLSGTITNSGSMTINAGGNNTDFTLTGDVTLNGGGTVSLVGPAFITGSGNRLTNVDNTIQGQGNLGNNAIAITNEGLINANLSGKTLTIDPANLANGFVNNTGGTVRASLGGTVLLTGNSGGSFTNNGTFEALDSSTFTMDATSILTNDSGGILTAGIYRAVSSGGGATLTLNGTPVITLAAGTEVDLVGAGSVLQVVSTALETSLLTNNGILKVLNNRNYTTSNAFANGATTSDTGLLQLGGGTFNPTSLINQLLSTIFGFGHITPRPTNHGLIEANGGTLAFANGILGGSGTVQIDPASVLDVSGGAQGSSADYLVHNGTTAGSLNLGTNNFVVNVDYTNANFGVGNSFNPRANVAGAGLIDASGNVTQVLTGNVTGGTTASVTMTFGNVHVGDSPTLDFQIGNGGTTGPALRGALQTSVNGGNITDARLGGSGVTASNFGPITTGGNTGNLAVTFNATSSGALSGQILHIINNFDNVGDQNLTIAGAAYRYANPTTHTPEPINFGNFHVNDTAPSQALSLTNNVPADGFSEALDASIGSPTGGVTTNSGGFTLLAPSATNSTSLVVGISTATAGNKSGTATITLSSDGTGSSGLGTSTLPSQTVNITGSVYRLAAPSTHTPDPVTFGIVHVNDVVASQAVSLTNTAANDGFSERLDASIGSPTTGVTTNGGSFSQLLPGSTDSTSLKVGISTVVAGSISGTASIALTSDGTGTSGLNPTTLTAQIVHVTGQVNYFADPLLIFKTGAATLTETDATHFTLDFGTVTQNTGSYSASFGVQNFLLDAVFQDTLGGTFNTAAVTNFGLSNVGAFSGIASGSALDPGVSFNSATAQGPYSNTLVLNPSSANASSTTPLNAIQLNLVVVVVPEPAGVLLLALGSSLLLARRRRR